MMTKKSLPKSKTKIICTLGPASFRKETILKMAQVGMSVGRLNFSHGNHEYHQEMVDSIRAVNKENGMDIKILQDLEGYRIRVGTLERPIEVMKYQQIKMVPHGEGDKGVIPLESEVDFKKMKKGMDIYIDDGHIHLRVLELCADRDSPYLELEVLHGGKIKSRKGVNIPKLKLTGNIMTEKDLNDVEFGLKNKVDFIAESFVRNSRDIERLVALVKPKLPNCQVLAKIENDQGVENVSKIIDACDGVMVARGDLGVSLPIHTIPIIQKDIIRRCNNKGVMVVTATQMLESMTDNARPTRAEVSDVANAILDGTDYVMLSGETAAGAYPVKAVRMMQTIIEHTEKHFAEETASRCRIN